MTFLSRCAMLGLVAVAISPRTARAAGGDCPTTPLNYDAASCDLGPGLDDACWLDTGTGNVVLTCSLAPVLADAQLIMVSAYGGASISAWGYGPAGPFCCAYDFGPGQWPDQIVAQGGAYDDEIAFTWTEGLLEWNLEYWGTGVKQPRMYGGAGGDELSGSNEDCADFQELLVGNAGGDRVFGGGGDDTIYGDAGWDLLMGDAGTDTIYCGADGCMGYGGDGTDYLYGDFVAGDSLYGGAGDDFLYGYGGADSLTGNDGDDYLEGGTEDDTLYGGADDDTMLGGGGADVMSGGEGDDVMDGGGGDDSMSGDDGADDMTGGPGGDTLCGDSATAPFAGDILDDGGAFPGVDDLWAAEPADLGSFCGDSDTYVACATPRFGPCNATCLTVRPPLCP